MNFKYDLYIDKRTKEKVKVMKYENIYDFDKLKNLIGDVYPNLNKAQTRIWENRWIIRYSDKRIRMIHNCIKNGEYCFSSLYEKYR